MEADGFMKFLLVVLIGGTLPCLMLCASVNWPRSIRAQMSEQLKAGPIIRWVVRPEPSVFGTLISKQSSPAIHPSMRITSG